MCCENWMKSALRTRGLRMTAQRQMILAMLHKVSKDVSAEELHLLLSQNENTPDLSTVYRTLELFEQINLVTSRTYVNNERRFELLSVRAPHFHIRCQRCGEITAVDLDTLDALAASLQQTYHFTAELEHLVIPGICGPCSQKVLPPPYKIPRAFSQGAHAHD